MTQQRQQLRTVGLVCGYGAKIVLRDVSLDVTSGEIVGIIGPNGAGKTTLLSAISGLIPVVRGGVTLDDIELTGRAPERINRAGVALVPEGRHVFPRLTVDENLRVAAVDRSRRSAFPAVRKELFDRFPVLGSMRTRRAGLLSGGQQQQLAIARALVGRPSVLLLDEPSLGLAPMIVRAVYEALAALRDGGTAILVVEQRTHHVLELADRAYVLSGGRICGEFAQGELDPTAEHMASAYFGMADGAVVDVEGAT